MLNFVDDWLVLGAGTKLAFAKRGARDSAADDVRICALLCVAYERPLQPAALRYIRRALVKHGEGDTTLASVHLAMTGLWPLKQPQQAAYRLFIADGLRHAISCRRSAKILARSIGSSAAAMTPMNCACRPAMDDRADVGAMASTAFIKSRVAKGTELMADESGSWNSLHAAFPMKRTDHSKAYSADGACTNGAEEFFSRLRRMEIGHHHKIAGVYIGRYASEAGLA